MDEIETAAKVLKEGGIIVYPTDTVWGLGCDATNSEAVKRIFQLKQRPENKSFIVLLENPDFLNKYLNEVPEVAWDLIENAEKPLTIVYEQPKGFAPEVLNHDGTIGIRITTDEFCKKLIRKLNKPLVSTSANISGQATDGSYSSIPQEILNGVDYVVKHRQNETKLSVPSTIIRLALNGEFKIIRK
jgi:L-threonylcarbamoyladenylate synthase